MTILFRTWTGSAISDVSSPSNWNPVNGYPPSGSLSNPLICMVGATSDRQPNNVKATRLQGQRFYDTTLSKLLVHDGYSYRDPATGLVA